MKNLILLRHASPLSKGPDGTDFSRPLAPEGEKEARLQGAFLREAGIVPQVIAASAAIRARTTAELMAGMLIGGPAVLVEQGLYNAPGEELLEYLRQLPEPAETVLLVAHMPGVAELLGILASDPADLAVQFKPCTLAGVSLPAALRWAELAPGTGVLEWLLPPIFAR